MNPCCNRRHNSLFNNCDKMILLSPQKSPSGSTNTSMSQSKMKLRSNSIFVYQEYDKYSSLFGDEVPSLNYFSGTNSNNNMTSTFNSNMSKTQNQEEDDQSSYQDSYSDTGNLEESSQVSGSPSNKNFGKRFSDGNVSLQHSKLLRNTDELFSNCLGFNNPPQVLPSKFQNNASNSSNKINDFRRNSVGISRQFTFLPTIQQKKISTFFNYNNNFPRSQFSKSQQKAEDQFVLENLSTLLQDQNRCRQLQEKLEEKKNDDEFIKLFYDLIEVNLVDIINHQFGNYVMQKLIEVLIYKKNKSLITTFFKRISGDLLKISVNNYGTRVFQKSLEKLDNGIYDTIETDELDDIIKNLIEKHLFALCYDKNGNHVFQKIVRIFPKAKNDFIYECLTQHAIEVSKLKQGVSILEASLTFANQSQKEKLLKTIINEIESLINDEYGNYVIQFIIKQKVEELNNVIYEYIKNNLLSLSQKKFSSNVIDKCIVQDDENSMKIIQCIIDNKLVKDMITDQYGNYVVQKALNVTKGYTFSNIIHQIQPALDTLKRSNIGRKIYEHLVRKYGEYFPSKGSPTKKKKDK